MKDILNKYAIKHLDLSLKFPISNHLNFVSQFYPFLSDLTISIPMNDLYLNILRNFTKLEKLNIKEQ